MWIILTKKSHGWHINNKHLAVALCSIHVELYDWLQVCLCFRRGIYRKSLWNKHDTMTTAQNLTDFFHQYNRCPSLPIKGTVCLSIQTFDHSVDWFWCSIPIFISLKVSRICCALLCSKWAISRCIMKLWATMSKVSLSCGWYLFK